MTTPIPRGKRLPLAVLCAATLITIVDETIVSVALPSIQRDLGFATSELSWVVNAYLIAFGGFVLLAGRIGDLVGPRRMLLGGIALFTAASAAAGAAQSPEALVAARFVQGMGGAVAAAVGLGMVSALFDDPGQRARAFGLYAFVGASGASIGLFSGGVITDLLDWRVAFWINVPIGIAAITTGLRVLSADGPRASGHADGLGAALLVGGLVLLIGVIVRSEHAGLSLPGLALATALLLAFGARQATAAQPLLPLRAIRARLVIAANLVMALLVGAMFAFQFIVALYFQRVLGYSPAEAGLAILPVALGIGAMSLLAFPRLEARFGARLLLAPGLVSVAAGLLLLTRVPVDASYLRDIAPSVALFALGGGLALPAVMTLAMSAAAPEDAGLASGVINTSQQVGGALGLAVLSTLAVHRSGGETGPVALVAGYHVAWAGGAAFLLAALLVMAWALRAQPARSTSLRSLTTREPSSCSMR